MSFYDKNTSDFTEIGIAVAKYNYGKKAKITLYGVELLNEGMGFSIDSTTTEKAYTFVCRSVDSMEAVDEDNPGKIYSTW